MPGQTVQTQIRLLPVCHSVYIVLIHYSMVETHSSTFRVITTNFCEVRIFRKFMVTDNCPTGDNGCRNVVKSNVVGPKPELLRS